MDVSRPGLFVSVAIGGLRRGVEIIRLRGDADQTAFL
jgi:hypothetical protein